MRQYSNKYDGDMLLYLEHTEGVWNIVDDGTTVYKTWNDEDITQHKIKLAVRSIERENGKNVDLKFRLNDMTVNELRERLNKDWEVVQTLEGEEGKLIDNYVDIIESDVKKYGVRHLNDKRSMFNENHAYHINERRIISKEEPWILEGRTLIDLLFSMINEEG